MVCLQAAGFALLSFALLKNAESGPWSDFVDWLGNRRVRLARAAAAAAAAAASSSSLDSGGSGRGASDTALLGRAVSVHRSV